MIFKRFYVLLSLIFIAVTISAQNPGIGWDLTVDDSYLSQSVELMIIREQSRSASREMKLSSMDFIYEAMVRGNNADEIRIALEHLGTEGIVNPIRENGRVTNDHPDIRSRAATYLGILGTPEAKDSLIRMCLAEYDPIVLTEIIKSLGNIGINENNQTVIAITRALINFDTLRPNNLLTLSALEAYEKIARTYGGISDPLTIQTIIRISQGPYIRPVQNRAMQLLSDLRGLN